jgi:hypothetical protein
VTTIALTLVARTATAEPPRLETPPDAECPSASELRAAIAAQIGRDDFDRSDAPSVSVRVRRSFDGSLAADVSVTTSATTTRTIDNADSCGELVRAAALSIALAIEEDAAEPRPVPPPPSAAPREEGQPRVEPPVRRDRVAVTASGLTSLGLLPRPAAGVGLAARARISERAWIGARSFWLPGATMPNETFALSLFAAGPGACVEPFGSTTVMAVGCAHVVGGAFEVTTTSVDMKSARAEAYIAANLSAGARARVHGPIHLEGALDAQLPFTRPTYLTTTCPPTGFEPPFVALALWFGAGVSIP